MRYALVTGAGRGLGRALLSELIRRGWTVIANVRSEADEEILINDFQDRVVPLLCDLTHPGLEEQIKYVLEHAQINALDCLVNNAGVSSYSAPLAQLDVSEVSRLINVNLLGSIRLAKICLPYLLRAEAPMVVNISSRLGSLGLTAKGDNLDSSYSYRISKAALNMFTLCMANDASLRRLKVLSLHPGAIRTTMGGPTATESAESAAKEVVSIIENNDSIDTGTFVNSRSERLEW